MSSSTSKGAKVLIVIGDTALPTAHSTWHHNHLFMRECTVMLAEAS